MQYVMSLLERESIVSEFGMSKSGLSELRALVME